jgi:hypothetical protein
MVVLSVAEQQRLGAIALRERVREILRKQYDNMERQPQEIIQAHREKKGGFIPMLLPAITAVASALPSVIEGARSLFGKGKGRKAKMTKPQASGKATAKPKAKKSKKANPHALEVKRIMTEAKRMGKPISLGEASKQAKENLSH